MYQMPKSRKVFICLIQLSPLCQSMETMTVKLPRPTFLVSTAALHIVTNAMLSNHQSLSSTSYGANSSSRTVVLGILYVLYYPMKRDRIMPSGTESAAMGKWCEWIFFSFPAHFLCNSQHQDMTLREHLLETLHINFNHQENWSHCIQST